LALRIGVRASFADSAARRKGGMRGISVLPNGTCRALTVFKQNEPLGAEECWKGCRL
jgi:hypothetical protein